ncbi:MAG: NAD(P)/FAD-dependent oxidoreductase [Candidatus Lokiarchaeota archaeon]|nr:NAD(P)/FAD-dependent oxidoreductase [Candidatus Lokiarchaeota archaeon]
MKCDVLVIGGGPSGSYAAKEIATLAKGYKILLIEDHKVIGKPVQCAGKISTRACRELNLPRKNILNTVKGSHFYSPSGNVIVAKKKNPQAYIIDRGAFDKALCQEAQDKGVELLLKTKGLKPLIKNGKICGIIARKNSNRIKIQTDVIIDAEGVRSLIAKKCGLPTKQNFVSSFQMEISPVSYEDIESVEVYFSSKYAPGFFSWIIPVNENLARVGIGASGSLKQAAQNLFSFIKSHPIASRKFGKNWEIKTKLAGFIPMGGPLPLTVKDIVMLVGDTAGHVKSTTGGGLYFGMSCAKIAAKVVVDALNNETPLQVRTYERLWRKKFGSELKKSANMRKFVNQLRDSTLDTLFETVSEHNLEPLLERFGDIDYQSSFVRPFASKLSFLPFKNPKLTFELLKAMILANAQK